jgi:hypothetical protein
MFLRALFTGSAAIALENLALRHQRIVLQRSVPRPRLARWDRIVWVWLCRWWTGWRSSLLIVQPATVLAWHRQGFQLYWRWKSKTNPAGRPRLDAAIRQLIGRMARENPMWGRRRIHAGLAVLGDEVAELTVVSTCTARHLGRRGRGAPFSPRIARPSASSCIPGYAGVRPRKRPVLPLTLSSDRLRLATMPIRTAVLMAGT